MGQDGIIITFWPCMSPSPLHYFSTCCKNNSVFMVVVVVVVVVIFLPPVFPRGLL
jgi:hypothetical protein